MMPRVALEILLRDWHIQADGVADGASALKRLRTACQEGRHYDLVMLDHQLADIESITLARMIKTDPDIASARLVLMSASGQRGKDKDAPHIGIAATLTKPIRQSQLHDCLKAVIGMPVELSPAPLLPQAGLTITPIPSRFRVLVAEDNIMNQKVAVRMLEKLGCRVDVAANGQEVLDALEHMSYDVIFMDCQMPELDGYEATATIRAREAQTGGHIPIIAMTANAMQGDHARCLAAGMDDYVSKPAQSATLAEMLQKWKG
jgi:CheY-like chemotaxis protein